MLGFVIAGGSALYEAARQATEEYNSLDGIKILHKIETVVTINDHGVSYKVIIWYQKQDYKLTTSPAESVKYGTVMGVY